MPKFNFPDPATGTTTVTNPVTNTTYQWKAGPNKWVITTKINSDETVAELEAIKEDIEEINQTIEDEIEVRNDLINAANGKNNAQDAAIAELDARVDSISENIGILEFKGIYTYKAGSAGDTIAAGTFISDGTDVLKDATTLVISTDDKNGDSLDWKNVLAAGDYLELAEPNTLDGGVNGGDTVLYEVTADPTRAASQETLVVSYIKETGNGDGLFDLDKDYTIRVFKKDLGIDINEADERYVRRPYKVLFADDAPATGDAEDGVLRSGELWYDTAHLELFVWNNNAWVSAAKPASQDVVVADAITRVTTLENKPSINYSTDAPVSAIEGDLWFNPNSLKFAFYTGGAWVNPDLN